MLENNLTVPTAIYPPWIGSGTKGNWKDWRNAMADSGLSYSVQQQPLLGQYSRSQAMDAVSNYIECIGIGAEDTCVWETGDHIATVSPDYKVVQNEDVFSLFNSMHDVTIVAAGETQQGLCFMVGKLNSYNINGEEYTQYIMATNSHNKKYACGYFFTTVRIICQNMYNKLKNLGGSYLIMHKSRAEDKIATASQLWLEADEYKQKFAKLAYEMQDIKLSTPINNARKMVSIIYPQPTMSTLEPSKRFQTAMDETEIRREMWLDKYWDSPTNQNHKDNVFGLINSYYDFMSHGLSSKPRANTVVNDKILSDIVSGTSQQSKVQDYIWSLV